MVPEESPDRKWLYYSGSGDPVATFLRRVPVDGGVSEEVLPQVCGRNWAVVDTGIWFLSPNSAGASELRFYDFASKTARTVYRTGHPADQGLTISPDRRRILFGQKDRPSSRNLMLVEHFR
jgi:hypothetical protein